MPGLKNKTQGNYVNVYKGIVLDHSLSLKDRGMLLTLLSLPDSWEFTIAGLGKILPDGKAAIHSSLASLQNTGYLTKEQTRGEKGAFGENILEVHETPVPASAGKQPQCGWAPELQMPTYQRSEDQAEENRSAKNRSAENRSAENRSAENRSAENRLAGKPPPDSPSAGKLQQLNNQQENHHEMNNQGVRNHPSINHPKGSRDGVTEAELYEEIIRKNISYEALAVDFPQDRKMLDEIVGLMTDIAAVKRESVRIGGENYPYELVKNRFLKLGKEHIGYVIESLNKNTGGITNIHAYMLTVLYNASNTFHSYINARVNHEQFGGGNICQ